MRRRRKDHPGFELVAALALLAAWGWTFSAGFRAVVTGIGFIGLSLLLVLAVVGVFCFFLKDRRQRAPQPGVGYSYISSRELDEPPPILHPPGQSLNISVPTSPPKAPEPSKTVDLVARLRSIDWFQFEKVVAVTYRKRGYHVRGATQGLNPA